MKDLIGINLLNIGFVSVEIWIDKIPIMVSILVGMSILTLNIIRIVKELNNKTNK